MNRSTTWRAAAAGVGATVLGLGAGHLTAGLVAPAASPALAVGSAVIDLTPRSVKEWAVASLGTADKPVLVSGVVLVVLGLGAAAGVLQARRGWGGWVVAALAAVAGLAAFTRPSAGAYAVLPALVAAAAAMLGLHAASPRLPRSTPTGDHSATGSAAGTEEPGIPRPSDASAVSHDPGRRVLLAAGGMTAGGVALAAAGAWRSRALVSPSLPAGLPTPASPLPAVPAGLEGAVPGLAPLRTPIADFYRIDTALVIPRVDAASWRLRIDGDVERPYELTFADLLAMPMVEADITLNCVSNPVGGSYIGSTRWLGVLTREVLARAGVRPTADQILSTSVDGMTISTPVAALQDDRGALLAIAMDGRPLTAAHGFPVRLVTPGLYGYVGATKWLARLTATTYADHPAYWSTRGWSERAEVKTQSRIDVPRSGESFSAGFEVVIAGVAWSQARQGISRVEVQVDDTGWHDATLGPDVGGHYWRQWRWTWPATSGQHRITVRATDGTGALQTSEVADPAPNGASGLHSIQIAVA
jgi:DMSO/TMAO reductase YedYZ molybdopterin-dependent catalytic subunit